MNFFVKFLILNTSPSIMLYGFAAPTFLPEHKWKSETVAEKRLKLICCSAVLSESDKNNLLCKLKTPSTCVLGKIHLSVNLVLRPTVLSDTAGLEWESNKPVSRLHFVDEYWCVNKDSIVKC